MKAAISKFCLAFLVTCFLPTLGITAEVDTIAVTLQNEISKKPDVAFIMFYVKGEGEALTDAIAEVNRKAKEIIELVSKEHKADFDQIKVKDGIFEKADRDFSSFSREEKTKYRAMKRVRITLAPEREKINKILATALNTGASLERNDFHFSNDLRGPVIYGLKNTESVELEAFKAVVEKAKETAEHLAKIAGKTIGGIHSVSESTTACSYQGNEYPSQYLSDSAEGVAVRKKVTVTFLAN